MIRSDEKITACQVEAVDVHHLRRLVLRPHDRSMDWPHDHEPETFHGGAFAGPHLVSVGTIRPEARTTDAPGRAAPGPDHEAGTAWRLRGMATDPRARRLGAGSAVLRLLTDHARASGATLVWCNARVGAIRFYKASGWVRLGQEFDLPSIGPHFVMELRLMPNDA